MAPWQLSSLMKGDKSRAIFSTFDLLVFMFVETVRYVSQDACILFTAANRYLLFILDPVGIVLDQTWKKVNLIFILALLLPFLKESCSVLSSWFQGGYYNFGSDFPIPQGPQTFVFVSGSCLSRPDVSFGQALTHAIEIHWNFSRLSNLIPAAIGVVDVILLMVHKSV